MPEKQKDSDWTKTATVLRTRFLSNESRHSGVTWDDVEKRLQKNKMAQRALMMMEESGGEPDVVGLDKKTGEFIFMDCSKESPSGRRSLCYDDLALEERKENKPSGSAMGFASEMGVDLLNEDEYKYLQSLGEFDLKTSSWLNTPAAIRKKGGAIFGDRRYDHVFTYHNGAQSYYAARGFRAVLRV